jgi:serine/threonine protein kinase/Tol biopolymer transport system component
LTTRAAPVNVALAMTADPGMLLGPYEVLASLGAGGMGEVFRARDSRLGREVALKILSRSQLRDPEALARFEAEARAVAALSHPNVRALYDLGESGQTRFAVMELLEGETLRARLFGGPLPPRKALEYALRITQGLAAAHDKGFVHRDIKPENVFLTRDGQVKILDFGLVQELTPPGQPPVKLPATVLGTVGYIAPEQARGHPADARADIFAFGAVLYEMLTGRRAFSGESAAEVMNAVVQDDPPPFGGSGARVPMTIDRLVRRCLEKAPGERFQSARDLGYAIEAALASFETDWNPRPTWRAPPRARRLAAGAALLALGIALGVGLQRLGRSQPVPPPVAIRPLTHSGADHAPAASLDGRLVAFSSDRHGPPRIWLKQLLGGSEAAVTDGPDDDPRFSPDGGTLLFTRRQDGAPALYRVPILGGAPRRIASDAGDGDWSPDGRRVAFLRYADQAGLRSTTLWLSAADGGGARAVARFENRVLRWPRFSPDGRALVLVDGGSAGARSPVILDPASGAWRTLPTWERGVPMAAIWLDSRRLACTYAVRGGGGRLMAQDVDSGELRSLLQVPSDTGRLDRLGPGRLVFESVTNRIGLAEIGLGPRSANPIRWLTREHAADRQPRFSPDGEWIVFSSNRSGNLDLWAVARRTGAVRRLTDDMAEDWDPAFFADGRLLWSSGRNGHLEVWMAEADGSAARQVSDDGVDAQNPTATPDGQWIVYDSQNPARRGIWKVRPDGSDARRVVAGATGVPEVSPDGRYVLYLVAKDGERESLQVAQVADGRPAPFEIVPTRHRPGAVRLGRARWTSDGRAIAFVGQDAAGVHAVFVQDFVPGRDTSASRRRLAGFDLDREAESFALSADGRQVVIAGWERSFSLVVVEGLPGLP